MRFARLFALIVLLCPFAASAQTANTTGEECNFFLNTNPALGAFCHVGAAEHKIVALETYLAFLARQVGADVEPKPISCMNPWDKLDPVMKNPELFGCQNPNESACRDQAIRNGMNMIISIMDSLNGARFFASQAGVVAEARQSVNLRASAVATRLNDLTIRLDLIEKGESVNRELIQGEECNLMFRDPPLTTPPPCTESQSCIQNVEGFNTLKNINTLLVLFEVFDRIAGAHPDELDCLSAGSLVPACNQAAVDFFGLLGLIPIDPTQFLETSLPQSLVDLVLDRQQILIDSVVLPSQGSRNAVVNLTIFIDPTVPGPYGNTRCLILDALFGESECTAEDFSALGDIRAW